MVINDIIKISMPLAFTFFSPKTASLPVAKQAETGPAMKWTPEIPAPESAFDPSSSAELKADANHEVLSPDAMSLHHDEKTHIIDTPPPRDMPQEVVLPKRKESAGFAAMVVNQSETAAPPLNRRPQSPFPTAPAHQSQPLFPSAPATSYDTWHASVEQTEVPQTLETLKQELQHEIEQVKADLFGAAMGVSALKDRLDGVESTVATQTVAAASPVSREEIQIWVSQWLDQNLPEALERAISQAQQKLTGSLSSQHYFRQPIQHTHTDRHKALIHPPIILASTPL